MNSSDTRPMAQPRTRLRHRMGETTWTRVRAGLSLGMVFGLGAVGTMAAWSDTATAESGVFSTSSVQLSLDGESTTHELVQLTRHSMLPGHSTAGAISVDNTGASDFDWSVSGQASGNPGLIDALQVGLYETSATNNESTTCTGTQIGSTQSLGTNPTLASGQPLTAGASQEVCIQVTVDGNAGEATQFKVANVAFEFVGEGQ